MNLNERGTTPRQKRRFGGGQLLGKFRWKHEKNQRNGRRCLIDPGPASSISPRKDSNLRIPEISSETLAFLLRILATPRLQFDATRWVV